jgi:hypothetical protein
MSTYSPSSEEAEHLWHATQVAMSEGRAGIRNVRRPRRTGRALVLAAAVLASASGVAVAADVVDVPWFGKDKPAGRVHAFDGNEPVAITPGPSAFNGREDGKIPSEALKSLHQMVDRVPASFPEDVQPGKILDARARVLLEDHTDRAYAVAIYAAPTSKGQICYLVEGMILGSSECVHDFDEAAPVRFNVDSDSSHAVVGLSGITADEVTSIDVRLSSGSVEQAEIGRNAFAWHAHDLSDRPTGLILGMSDGTKKSVEVPNSWSS